MPIYEYRCEDGHTFEVMKSITDDPDVFCKTCSKPVQRVYHPVAVHFKGKGFYNTDYGTRKRQREQKESAESSGAGKDSSADKGSGDGAKPAKASKDSADGAKASSGSPSSG